MKEIRKMTHGMMKRVAWYANRLKAMSVAEVGWRLQQKWLQHTEKKRFGEYKNIAEAVLYAPTGKLRMHHERDRAHNLWGTGSVLRLTSTACATEESAADLHAENWDAGYAGETNGAGGEKKWPAEWAYSLRYKQRDDIGDARLSWEINRHLHWPRLALNFVLKGERTYLDELDRQLTDWSARNPMLYGIAWTSVMEVAIRAIQWTYTAQIITDAMANGTVGRENIEKCRDVAKRLATGAENMMWYVSGHRSRHSSANNHLLVELAALVITGCYTGADELVEEATKELTREIPLQFSADGVNKEVSLHYHTFAMEAYMLAIAALRGHHRNVPGQWETSLRKWARFTRACMASETEAIEFGDSDKGVLLNLTGRGFDYYRYVLQGASVLSGEPVEAFSNFQNVEPTVKALSSPGQQERLKSIKPVEPRALEFFSAGRSRHEGKESGFAILRADRSENQAHEMTVGIDCAPMGFGTIAAHAHADMLSFQLYYNGKAVLTDGGTYLYHCGAEDRNLRRSELMHNTIAVAGHAQGEMLGPFLWGKRGEAWLNESKMTATLVRADCSARMADGTRVDRKFVLERASGVLTVTDSGLSPEDTTTFIVAPGIEVTADGQRALAGEWELTCDSGTLTAEPTDVAREYGKLERATALRLRGRKGTGTVTIHRITSQDSGDKQHT